MAACSRRGRCSGATRSRGGAHGLWPRHSSVAPRRAATDHHLAGHFLALAATKIIVTVSRHARACRGHPRLDFQVRKRTADGRNKLGQDGCHRQRSALSKTSVPGNSGARYCIGLPLREPWSPPTADESSAGTNRRAVHCLMEREVSPVAPHPPLPAEAPRVAGLFLGRLLGRLNDIVVRVRRPKSARLRQRSGEWSKRRVRGESIGASPVALPRCRP